MRFLLPWPRRAAVFFLLTLDLRLKRDESENPLHRSGAGANPKLPWKQDQQLVTSASPKVHLAVISRTIWQDILRSLTACFTTGSSILKNVAKVAAISATCVAGQGEAGCSRQPLAARQPVRMCILHTCLLPCVRTTYHQAYEIFSCPPVQPSEPGRPIAQATRNPKTGTAPTIQPAQKERRHGNPGGHRLLSAAGSLGWPQQRVRRASGSTSRSPIASG